VSRPPFVSSFFGMLLVGGVNNNKHSHFCTPSSFPMCYTSSVILHATHCPRHCRSMGHSGHSTLGPKREVSCLGVIE
jgi:hypothetical protein